MSLLSAILGRKPKPIEPDFKQVETNAIALGTHTFRYVLPGNMSTFINFAQRRKAQVLPEYIDYYSPREHQYTRDDWREAMVFDSGMWDYAIDEDDLVNGDVTRLTLSLDVCRTPHRVDSSILLNQYVEKAYRYFLEGPEGLNTQIRHDFPNLSDDELSLMLIAPPASIDQCDINGRTWLKWQIYGEARGGMSEYFILPLDDNHFLMARFRYAMTGYADDSQDKVSHIRQDIDSIVNSFVLN